MRFDLGGFWDRAKTTRKNDVFISSFVGVLAVFLVMLSRKRNAPVVSYEEDGADRGSKSYREARQRIIEQQRLGGSSTSGTSWFTYLVTFLLATAVVYLTLSLFSTASTKRQSGDIRGGCVHDGDTNGDNMEDVLSYINTSAPAF
jgi:hypothetical protein